MEDEDDGRETAGRARSPELEKLIEGACSAAQKLRDGRYDGPYRNGRPSPGPSWRMARGAIIGSWTQSADDVDGRRFVLEGQVEKFLRLPDMKPVHVGPDEQAQRTKFQMKVCGGLA